MINFIRLKSGEGLNFGFPLYCHNTRGCNGANLDVLGFKSFWTILFKFESHKSMGNFACYTSYAIFKFSKITGPLFFRIIL